MSVNGFKEGKLTYTVRSGVTAEALAPMVSGKLGNGFIAFATSEHLFAALNGKSLDARFLGERVQGLAGAEGYVSEVNLWRKDGAVLEEIAAEREENTFYVQEWRLEMAPIAGSGDCWYRAAATSSGSHHKGGKRLFSGELKSIEVIQPDKRLNFYLTTEGA